LPHAYYVLRRLQDAETLDDLQIEHIYPQNPSATWTGDGDVRWDALTTEQQARGA
jgi:hypothetical protein